MLQRITLKIQIQNTNYLNNKRATMNTNGWIKIHRKMLDWEWYTDTNTTRVFFHLLLTANFEDKKFCGKEVKRGQVVIGRHSLAELLGISEQSVRTAINHLISTNEITIKTTNKFTIVTICNYDSYQVLENQTNQQINQQLTNNQPTTNQQLTTTKEYKEYKKERIEEEREKKADKSATRSQFQKPTIEECFSYCKELGLSTYDYNGQQKSQAQTTAEAFFDYYESNGWKVGKNTMKNWRAALNGWIRRDAQYNKTGGSRKSVFSDEQTDALITMFTGSANN